MVDVTIDIVVVDIVVDSTLAVDVLSRTRHALLHRSSVKNLQFANIIRENYPPNNRTIFWYPKSIKYNTNYAKYNKNSNIAIKHNMIFVHDYQNISVQTCCDFRHSHHTGRQCSDVPPDCSAIAAWSAGKDQDLAAASNALYTTNNQNNLL